MPTDAIRDTIELAKQHEHQHGNMAALIDSYVQQNSLLLVYPPGQSLALCLMEFIIAYTDYVPDFIDAARTITLEANIQEYSEPFISLAEAYFLQPPEMANKRYGLVEILDEAYLAHRLLEEINDRFMAKTAFPLVPVDMAMSNVLVHSLIGEPFANELDEAVQFTAERAMINQQVYETAGFITYVNTKNKQRLNQIQSWPCLMDKLSIELQPLTRR